MQQRSTIKAATIAIVAALAMSACRNGPNNAIDTNAVNTGGAAGQVLLSPADTIRHDTSSRDTSARAAGARDTSMRPAAGRDKIQRRP